MDVTFRQLQLFLALSETGSVTAVARKFHVSQPTVSMQLRDLSESVGFPLYEIIGKRLYLTAAGEELKGSAQLMVGEWGAFEGRMAEMKGVTRGRLRMALVSTAKYFVPKMLGSFCLRFPEIEIAMEILNRDGVVARLRENRDDFYIMSMPPADIEVEARVFLPNPLVVIAPASHRLVGRESIEMEELVSERFILREKGSGTRLMCDAFFQKHGFEPKLRLELGSNEAIKQSVAGGMGLAVVSRHTLSKHLGDESLGILEVEGFPIHSNWYTVTLKGKRLSPPAVAFLEYLNTTAPTFAD